MNYLELFAKLEALRAQYKAQWDAYPTKKMADGQEAKDIPAGDIEGLRKLMADIDEVGKAYNDAYALHRGYESMNRAAEEERKAANRPGYESKADGGPQGVVERLLSKAGKLAKGVDCEVDWDPRLEMKTTMTTSAGFTPFSGRSGVVVPTVQVKPTLLDYLPVIPVTQSAYKFMKETTFTNNAGVKAEGVAYDEAALALTETTVSMNRLGVYIPVTDDQLEDEAGARAYIEDRLKAMARIKAEAQVLNGTGVAPQWNGILGLSGLQSTDASAFASKFDAVFQAILNVNSFAATTNGGAMANLVVLNPADWQDLVTLRTADGIYILQNPGDAPLGRVWGLPVVENFTIASGTGLVLDTTYFPVGIRRQLAMKISDSHGEYFIEGKLAVRVDLKGNVIAYRDAAANKITNL